MVLMPEEASASAPPRVPKLSKEPRKHHYVPVFYQKCFASDNELLWVYDRGRQTYKELHPLVVCFEKDLYALKSDDKPVDVQVETKVLRVVDILGSIGIRDFQKGKPNTEAEKAVALFTAFQWARVPAHSRDSRAGYATLIEELMRISFANVERARVMMERYAPETKGMANVTPESMVESIQGKHLTIEATEVTFLTYMMKQSVKLAQLLVKLDWEVLIAPNDTGFIICDCPVVVVPPRGSDQVGFVVPGSAKYFPLSRHLCLRLGEPGRTRTYRKIDKEAVRIVNQNIAANSERFIMGPSRAQLENIVARSKCERMESIRRFVVETVESDDDSALQKMSAQPRRYFYRNDGSAFAP